MHPEAHNPRPNLSEVILLQTPVLLLHRWGSVCRMYSLGVLGGRCLAHDPHRIGQHAFYLPNARPGSFPYRIKGNTDRSAPLGGVSITPEAQHRRSAPPSSLLFVHCAQFQPVARSRKPCLERALQSWQFQQVCLFIAFVCF